MDTWTDEHSRLVAQASPPATDIDLDRTWEAIQTGIETTAPARRSRKGRLMIGAGVAAAVVSVSGVAAAGILSARTGEYPSDAEDLRLGGPGEALDPAGGDFRRVIEEEIRDIPFPSLAARKVSVDEHVRDLKRDNDPEPRTQSVTSGAIRGWTAVHAVCSWSNEWVRAGRAGDTTAEAEAARMLVGSRHWPAITALDSVQRNGTLRTDVRDPETGQTTTGTIPDPTQYYFLRLVSKAVKAGDVDALGDTLADNAYCIGTSLVPDFQQALPAGFQGR
ncbi:hypothetical protein [Nocardioides sp. InS609-2]|uniref:hypothetical protein n=1 Tax=Nocardioides sp. InS609-2 TaxID=2760705 RepID=UPI0020BEE091|nr:hypothetical protein [Nocardioides sp. InS609-2]